VKNNPITKTDPNGLGPITFGACTTANGVYQVYSFRQTMKEIDSNTLELLQSVLNRVNNELEQCPASNVKRRAELEAIRNNLAANMVKVLQGPAKSANMFGIGDIGSTLIGEGVCAALSIAPSP
jgi:hypothetical protein